MQINKRDDNGLAFPFVHGKGFGTSDAGEICLGMTLRDYFAAQAIIAVLSMFGYTDYNAMAKDCYNIADAMIAERKSHVKQAP